MHKKEIIEQINHHVIQFKNWLKENYTQERIGKELYDDTGYPNWTDVEDTFEIAFKELEFKNLSKSDLKNIGFLIARQWDVGVIFPYFREEISEIGMTENQLLILAEFGINSKEWSLRQQCSASIWKAKNHQKKAIEIALKYYKDKDDDIRRHSLNSLYKLEYENLNQLLDKSWSFDNEDERILCLEIWRKVNKEKFEIHLKEVDQDEREYMKKYVSKFVNEK